MYTMVLFAGREYCFDYSFMNLNERLPFTIAAKSLIRQVQLQQIGI
jgi:hypothetical protein